MQPIDTSLRGKTQAAMSLQHKSSGENTSRKKKLIKDIVKGGKDKFDPDPEIDEVDTIVKT